MDFDISAIYCLILLTPSDCKGFCCRINVRYVFIDLTAIRTVAVRNNPCRKFASFLLFRYVTADLRVVTLNS
jgi:hypothetical protein